jgi:hypothetical protein
VVATWNGSIEDGHLLYAAPHHPEYRCYVVSNLLVANAEGAV